MKILHGMSGNWARCLVFPGMPRGASRGLPSRSATCPFRKRASASFGASCKASRNSTLAFGRFPAAKYSEPRSSAPLSRCSAVPQAVASNTDRGEAEGPRDTV